MAALDPDVALERLRSTPRDLVALIGPARPERLRRAPAEGEWSPATVVSHLGHAELVYSVRLRLALTEDRPYLTAFDEGAWCRRLAELDHDPKEALARWRSLRAANLALFESLDEDEWRLTAVHAERGEMSVARIATVMVEHDREHLAQIRAGLADR